MRWFLDALFRYQMAAYLGAYGRATESLAGALVYPVTSDMRNIFDLQAASPWRLPAAARQLWFLGLLCQPASTPALELTLGEQTFVTAVQTVIAQRTALAAAIVAMWVGCKGYTVNARG